MGEYKGYDPEVGKKAKLKYVKEKQHRVEVSWRSAEFAERIEPFIKEAKKPAATFIKEAVDEKVARMNKS